MLARLVEVEKYMLCLSLRSLWKHNFLITCEKDNEGKDNELPMYVQHYGFIFSDCVHLNQSDCVHLNQSALPSSRNLLLVNILQTCSCHFM